MHVLSGVRGLPQRERPPGHDEAYQRPCGDQPQGGSTHRAGGCPTLFVAGYVGDGPVPVEIVRKLLAEKPAIAGITLPGMPLGGSPGMPGQKTVPSIGYGGGLPAGATGTVDRRAIDASSFRSGRS
jgi:Protein of unknown function, DUF